MSPVFLSELHDHFINPFVHADALGVGQILQPCAQPCDLREAEMTPEERRQELLKRIPGDLEEHERFMREAIDMAELALRSDETPVGCVLVRHGEVIGRGMNDTNRSMNGTRHAEFLALSQVLSQHPTSILRETILYVTVEPCIMCASLLRQFRIHSVYFGCYNERFGGTGGVLNVHSHDALDPPYPVYAGIFREEAIMLLRRFYVQENEKAPRPKTKGTRELKTVVEPMKEPLGARRSKVK